jgi:iron-sulfur cluster biosynthesis transcriptional regulator SufR
MEALTERQMQETRRKILQLLKFKGEMTADQLGQALKITSMGVRRHLTTLERDGLIQYRTMQRGMGRPSYLYALTAQGDELFPRTYEQLANSLLETVKVIEGESGVEQLFAKRTDLLAAQYRARIADKDLKERVAELSQIRTEEGYMADWEMLDEDAFLLREHNCAICQVAKRSVAACSHELELFRRVLDGAEVLRKSHIVRGDRTCTYLIQRKKGKRSRAKRTSYKTKGMR